MRYKLHVLSVMCLRGVCDALHTKKEEEEIRICTMRLLHLTTVLCRYSIKNIKNVEIDYVGKELQM